MMRADCRGSVLEVFVQTLVNENGSQEIAGGNAFGVLYQRCKGW